MKDFNFENNLNDLFIFDGCILEGYSERQWTKKNLLDHTCLKRGIIFKPNLSLKLNDLNKNHKFCLINSDIEGFLYCITDLSYDELTKEIYKLKQYFDDRIDNISIQIFDMADSISFNKYERQLKMERIKKTIAKMFFKTKIA